MVACRLRGDLQGGVWGRDPCVQCCSGLLEVGGSVCAVMDSQSLCDATAVSAPHLPAKISALEQVLCGSFHIRDYEANTQRVMQICPIWFDWTPPPPPHPTMPPPAVPGSPQDEMIAASEQEEGGHRVGSVGKLHNILMQMRKNCNHPDLITSAFTQELQFPSPEVSRGHRKRVRMSCVQPCARRHVHRAYADILVSRASYSPPGEELFLMLQRTWKTTC